ncbi:MAG: glutaredoxin family protein [Myxococcales bacterium]|nr:glutaredoxin family protein [Myxococcales bacterium]
MLPILRSLGTATAVFALVASLGAPLAANADGPPAGPFVYTDANGSVRMVQTFDEVPAARRSSMRTLSGDKVEYQSRVSTMTEQRAARARAQAAKLAKQPERRRDPVIFYSATWCGYCNKTRSYLQKRGIPYDERDIDQGDHRRELKRKTGSAMVPVVQYEDRVVIGWNPRAIDALGR